MRQIGAVLFDLDDTLTPETDSNEASVLAACESIRDPTKVDCELLRDTVRTLAGELWYGGPAAGYCRELGISPFEGLWGGFAGDDPALKVLREWVSGYRQKLWSQALSRQGIGDHGAARIMADSFIADRRKRHAAFADSRPALELLRESFALGLVTNGASDMQREKLQCSGLASFFSAVVISCEVGLGKPDQRIFQIALDQLGVLPEAAVMVGDNPVRDLAGAMRSGMLAVWVNRRKHAPVPGLTYDFEIRDLKGLPAILERFRRFNA